jgi:AbrB family looped-hinge helix DNA binding protein
MREIWASVTERGQVTIPAEVRKALGLKKRDKVVFRLEDGVVVLKRPPFTIETAYASIKPLRQPEDWDARIREAKDERADRLVEKMRKGEA